MFQKAKNIDTAFRQTRFFCFFVVICSVVISIYTVYTSNQLVLHAAGKIYILANGKALEAYGADRKDNIPVEARDHIKTFHQYFFNFDPDDKVITANITKALYLADASAKSQYDDLKESNYYTSIISGNISQQISIDSIQVNIVEYPFYFRFYGKQKIIRPTNILTRSLITEGNLRNVERSDNNSHGFLIERWRILENKDITTQSR